MDENLIIYAVVALIVALLIRDILCWFWKINKIVSRLESIDGGLKTALSEIKRIGNAAVEASEKGSPASPAA
jgi:hypothetical protein